MTTAIRSGQVLDELARPVPGSLIYVYNLDGTEASLTSDGVTPITQPLTTDQFGNYTYQALVGYYREDTWFEGKLRFRENNIALGSPGADLALRTDLAASSGSALTGTIRPEAGAVARTVQDKLRETLTAEDFGAVGNGTTDDSAALNAAIAAGGTGGTIVLKAGKTYAIASTLSLTITGARLICLAGDGDNHDTGSAFTAPTTLKWIGASGGTMVKVKSAGAQFISGNEVRGIFLDGNSGLAAVGLNLVGCRLGTFAVVGQHFTTAILKMDPDTALSEPQGCSENRIIRVSGYQTNVGDGAHVLLTCTASWNCSQNVFELISGDFRNSYAIDIQGSDSETFQVIKLFATLTSSIGVRLKGGATALQAARNNMFHYLAVTNATVPLVASGTSGTYTGGSADTYPSVENNISFLDTANNPNLPTIDTGSSLWWATIRSPLGLRSYSPNTAGNSVRQEASGLIIQSGTSASIAAGGSATITLPQAFPTGAISVQVTPKNAGMTFYADCSATQLVINNTGGSAAVFRWRVEGV